MESTGTCPRGHAVEDDAVYCTVCWVRVVPEDPEVLAARRRRRRFRLPLIAAGAVLLGAAAGLVLSQTRTAEPAIVAQPAAATPAAIVPAQPSSSPEQQAAEQPIVVSQPEAATIADPALTSETACSISIAGTPGPCTIADGRLAFETCVPGETVTLEVRSRPGKKADWVDVSTDAQLGAPDGCETGFVTAAVVIDAADAGTGDGTWKLVARDSAGDKVWKAKFETTTSQE